MNKTGNSDVRNAVTVSIRKAAVTSLVVGVMIGTLTSCGENSTDTGSGDETVTVSGALYDDGMGLQLCDGFMESFPPQCVDGVPLLNPNNVPLGNLASAEGISWTDHMVDVTGTQAADGTITIQSIE